ncbi:MAG: hypothetical protein NUV46_04410 [Nanoarchaeota archaeon]|nr:hypothetical protein [Nanoarchaeota archaeon]
MEKNREINNALIKRKGLIKILREKGIKRISKKGEEILKCFIFEEVEKLINKLKNEMDTFGKRVLDEETVESFIKNRGKIEDIDY